MTIYVITCTLNGKQYVGQTTRSLKVRFGHHRRCHRSDMPISVAMDQLGAEHFTIAVLEECASQTELNRREAYWVEALKTLTPHGYNTSRGTGRRESTKDKISAALKGRKITWGEKISAACIGRPFTDRQRAALKPIHERLTEAMRVKISANNRHRKVTDADIVAIRTRYAAGGVSQQALADEFGIKQVAVSRIVRRVTFRWLQLGED